jgi:WD40 repeat protein
MDLTPIARIEAADHVSHLDWSADGAQLAVTPVAGPFLVWDGRGAPLALPGHGLGNGAAAWHPAEHCLATAGTNGAVRHYDALPASAAPRLECALGRGWIERVRWSPDGRHLAAALGKRLVILDRAGRVAHEFAGHRGTVCDFAWNPQRPDEIASVGDGGAHFWRLGEAEAFARFDWGGASLIAAWSADGRWLATGDQTPSVHLYDFTRDAPLFMEGYETKVKALAFNSASRRLATGGGPLVTLWSCTGKTGPEGTTPRQLEGHEGDCLALAWRPGSDLLASGGEDGFLILFEPEISPRPRAIARLESAVTALAWHPVRSALAAGTAGGGVVLFEVS